MMDKFIKEKIDLWTKPPYDQETIDELNFFLAKKDFKELKDRFYTSLDFGTGGLRGIMGAGTNRINIYTIGMATQGLANYIKKENAEVKGVVVAYDSRNRSDLFAREVAQILAGNGIKVYIFADITPTPLASFAIKELKAISGVVITASHNPPEYNGYKVYWQSGGQVVPPHDQAIIDEVNKIKSPHQILKEDFAKGLKKNLILIVEDKILELYLKKLDKMATKSKFNSEVKIVYSPLHGTGYKIIPQVLSHFKFNNLFIQSDQAKPDGNFPTVKSPNPEEKEAFKLSLELATKVEADLVVATDPDADRMGVAFEDHQGGYLLINGNQIGSLLLYYLLLKNQKQFQGQGKGLIIKTIVTTDLQKKIAEDFGLELKEVLTGFKWIAAMMDVYEAKKGYHFIFAGEESYGYLPVDFVRDKDAVSSVYFMAEMTSWLKEQGLKLIDFLDQIYLKYGLYLEDLHSLTLKGFEGQETIKKIMKNFRSDPPQKIGDKKIDKIFDYKSLIIKNFLATTKREEPLKDIPASNVLQFFLEDGSKITMRPSGTEPKVKFYFSVNQSTSPESIERDKKDLEKYLQDLKESFLEEINDFLEGKK
jgi:phosphoglucomutase